MSAPFDRFLQRACPQIDLAWRKYRRRPARRAVEARIRDLGLTGYDAYLERLAADPAEADALADRMRITVSRFFRERARWDALARDVLPALVATRRPGEPLRAWSAGCCGGEEPYSLTILWLDAVQAAHPTVALDVLATDIDDDALARARAGAYAATSLREMPLSLRERWLEQTNGTWRVDARVRRLVRFAHHDLMTDPAPRDIDLVLCRYLAFTYFVGRRQQWAATTLWRALRPGGALWIGAREALEPAARELFAPWPGVEGVFRARSGRELAPGTPFLP